MEVMFAVAILATGLVFVACQFPVGLVTCKDVLDETSHGVNVHNAQTMLELDFAYYGFAYDMRPYDYRFPIGPMDDPGRVHLLVKPNVLADSLYTTGQWMLVEDDLEFTYALGGSPANPLLLTGLADYIIASSFIPRFPFWTEPPPSNTTATFLSDIGNMVLPPVDGTDPVVESTMRQFRLATGLPPTDADYQLVLNQVICDEALNRLYSWAAMYFQGDTTTQYMFTFRNPQKATRYAVQYPPSFCYQNVGIQDIDPLFNDRPPMIIPPPPDMRIRPVLPSDPHWDDERFQDRLFPVPWRVALDDITTGHNAGPHVNGCTHFYYDHGGGRAIDPDTMEPTIFPRSFTVDAAVGVLLRPGSIIIDADPEDILRKYEQSIVMPPAIPPPDRTVEGCGYIYEVQDIVPDTIDPTRFLVTLKTPLVNDMVYCWIFPPPIERVKDSVTGAWIDLPYEFEDQQPVINVTKKRLK